MNYTDTQLKQALAKMLPETIDWDNNCLGWIGTRNVRTNVRNTELLHLCWLAEETLQYEQKGEFTYELYRNPTFFRCVGYDGLDDWNEVFSYAHATWQQRTIALAQVKGAESV